MTGAPRTLFDKVWDEHVVAGPAEPGMPRSREARRSPRVDTRERAD